MKDNIDTPAFAIYGLTRKPKVPEPPPPPTLQTRPPSDEALSSSSERAWDYAAARPVYRGGQPTGEWQVSTLRHKNDSTRRWIAMQDQDYAYEWCMRVNAHRSENV